VFGSGFSAVNLRSSINGYQRPAGKWRSVE
jgi:hypothetical protein